MKKEDIKKEMDQEPEEEFDNEGFDNIPEDEYVEDKPKKENFLKRGWNKTKDFVRRHPKLTAAVALVTASAVSYAVGVKLHERKEIQYIGGDDNDIPEIGYEGDPETTNNFEETETVDGYEPFELVEEEPKEEAV